MKIELSDHDEKIYGTLNISISSWTQLLKTRKHCRELKKQNIELLSTYLSFIDTCLEVYQTPVSKKCMFFIHLFIFHSNTSCLKVWVTKSYSTTILE